MTKEELKERTKQFAIGVFKIVQTIPKGRGNEVISNQLIRCSSSVAANYRAACKAKSKADFIYKLKIVEEELDESMFWMEFAVDLSLLNDEETQELRAESNVLISIFTASLKTLKNYKAKESNPKP